MKINVFSKNIEITPSISNYIEKKIKPIELFLKYFEKNKELILFFEIARTTKHHKGKDIFYTEATLSLFNKTIRIEEYNFNLYNAIDVVKRKLKNDIIKYKEKVIDMKADRKHINKNL